MDRSETKTDLSWKQSSEFDWSPGEKSSNFSPGLGATEDQAINESFVNFVLTTFHPVYKSFINADDPHLDSKPIDIQGVSRNVVFGDVFCRGASSIKELDLIETSDQVENALASLQVSPDSHWIKIVYAQMKNEPATVSATIDNLESPDLTTKVSRLNWPKREEFYMFKQFIVIMPAQQ